MQLSPTAIQEFKIIYREEFGEDLSDAEAEEMALRVLRLFWILLQPPSEAARLLSEKDA